MYVAPSCSSSTFMDIIKLKFFKNLKIFFWCMLHLATCIFSFFYNKPELDARIDPGMTLAPFSSSILDETRFEPTTFE